jgi:hypothetical protein
MPALAILMPYIWTALRIFMVANVVGFVVRILVALGLNFVILEPAVDTVVGILQGQFSILPPVVASWVGFFNVDRYFTIIISAYATAAATNFVLRINR